MPETAAAWMSCAPANCVIRKQQLHDNAPVYVLEDGSRLHRVDRDTFRVLGTGAFVTVIRE